MKTHFEFFSDFLNQDTIVYNRSSLQKFLTNEYLFLTDSSSLNIKKFNKEARMGITSLDNYLNYPLILIRSLFNALDTEKNKAITIEEYVNGMLKIYTGELKKRIEFVFNMFNINEDKYMHKEDLSLILKYTHIYYNKKREDLLDGIIKDFFGKKSKISLKSFIKKTIKKNSSIFLIIMCILFEYKTHDCPILYALEKEITEPDTYQNTKNTSHRSEQNKNCDELYEIVPPKRDTVEYLKVNFNIDFSALKYKSDSEDDSSNSFCDSIDTEDNLNFEEDITELNKFESDLVGIKGCWFENGLLHNNYNLPLGGTKHFEMRNGVMTSLFNSRIVRSDLNPDKSLKSIGDSSFQNSFQKSSSNLLSFDLSSPLNKSTSQGNMVQDHPLTADYSNLPQNFLFVLKGHGTFTENVLIYRERKTSFKKYNIVLFQKYLLVYKSKVENLSIEGSPKSSKLRMFIPIKHLYIDGIEDEAQANDGVYSKITLISTLKFKKEKYEILFEDKFRMHEFQRMILKDNKSSTIKKDYTFLRYIGRGAFCQIFLARQKKTNKLFSIKKIEKKHSSRSDFSSMNWEKDIVHFLKNFENLENIIKFYDIVENNKYIYIIMDYMDSGSLGHYMRRHKKHLLPTVVKQIMTQILNGTKCLHEYGIIHRDLKLDNLLVHTKEDGSIEIKIIDFGLSQVLTPFSKTREIYGTLLYSSPEILLGIPYDKKVDVWSIGIIGYYLEFSQIPFDIKGNEDMREISQKIILNPLEILKKKFEENSPEQIKAALSINNFIKSALCKHIEKRPEIADLIGIINNTK